ncbi:hypothetical protein [Streptomyces sp. NPDC002640]
MSEEPPEHRRFARHLAALEALETVGDPEEAEAVTTVLRDEDATMAQSAVLRHVDRTALRLLADPAFPAWVRALTGVVAGRHFLTRRLEEWTLLRAIAVGGPWTPEELTTSSDWCQRTAVSERVQPSPEALALLAAHGRTRRVRNAATRRGGGSTRPAGV